MFEFEPKNIFKDSSAYPNPNTEEETRGQLSRPLEQLRDYLNTVLFGDNGADLIKNGEVSVNGVALNTIAEQLNGLFNYKVGSTGTLYLKVEDGNIFSSVNGQDWISVGGHKIMNDYDDTMPNRMNLQFLNATVEDDEENNRTVIKFSGGEKGEPGPGVIEGGTQGQVLAKKTDLSFDTEWATIYDKDQMDEMIKGLNQSISNMKAEVDKNVADVQGKLIMDLSHATIPVDSWVVNDITSLPSISGKDVSLTAWPHKVEVTVEGMTENDIPEVEFDPNQADLISGNLCPKVASQNGSIVLFAKEVPDADLVIIDISKREENLQ